MASAPRAEGWCIPAVFFMVGGDFGYFKLLAQASLKLCLKVFFGFFVCLFCFLRKDTFHPQFSWLIVYVNPSFSWIAVHAACHHFPVTVCDFFNVFEAEKNSLFE